MVAASKEKLAMPTDSMARAIAFAIPELAEAISARLVAQWKN
jgi:hypothetical protein